MSTELLAVLVIVSTTMVVVALFLVLWRRRTSARESWVVVISGAVLAAWAVIAAVLASRGFFRPPDAQSAPPIGIFLAVVLLGLALCLGFSASLRSLLTNQKHLIWLNVWRLLGIVFLILMANGQVPALWALPAGIGDIIVGATAPWVATRVDAPGGRRRAIIFSLFGMADLIVAVGLGITTSPGRLQVFQTTPTTELMTKFPMAVVPSFLVPLAFMLHVASLWQLLGRKWAPRSYAVAAGERHAG